MDVGIRWRGFFDSAEDLQRFGVLLLFHIDQANTQA